MKLYTIFFIFLLILSCNKADVTSYDSTPIDPSLDPYQENLSDGEVLLIEKNGWKITITKKAFYRISGLVVSKHSYSDFNSFLVPVDLALVFGDLYKSSLYKELRWSQSGRWYFYEYDSSFPKKDNSYISRYSSNNHIIPSSDNLKRAINKIRKGDLVVLEGYLVYVEGKKKNKSFYLKSSLSRNDSGGGSCEIIYLTKLKINENVYE